MLDNIKKHLDRKTIDKIEKMLQTPEGELLMKKLQGLDKGELIAALGDRDFSGIDFGALNTALQNVDVNEILSKLNGGNQNG